VRGTEGVANAMQIISNITRQTSQGARQTSRTVEQLVHMSEQLNEALSQFRVVAANPNTLPSEARPELVSAATAMSRR
jgi:ABC-type transporter Mla subunit MlaD